MLIIQETVQKIHANQSKLPHWLDGLLLILLCIFIISGVTLVPFHGDETSYIWMSQDYDSIIKQGNLSDVRFTSAGSPNQTMRLSVGSVLSFSIGFIRDITKADNVTNNWNWRSSWEDNLAQGNLPSQQTLILSRLCSASMGALSMVFFFLAVHTISSSRVTAWVATLLLATHGDILVNFRRAMQEGPKFLFLTITLYFASYIFKDLMSGRKNRLLYGLLGLASGLTLATKQDTAPILIAVYFALAFIPVWEKEKIKDVFANILYLGAATSLAFASFLAVMPVFWGWWESAFAIIGFTILVFQLPVWKTNQLAKPLALAGVALIIGMTIISPTQWKKFPTPITSMVEVRKTLVKGQVDYYTRNNLPYLNTFKNKMGFLLENIFRSKVMYMEVSTFDIPPINAQINAYETSMLHGRIGSPFIDVLVAVLFVSGTWKLFKNFSSESLLIFSMFIISIAVLLILVVLPWQRYFLILQIPYSIMAGIGAVQVLEWGTKFFKTRI